MSAPPECIHGMQPDWCSLCRKLPDPDVELASRPRPTGPGPWFEARWPSRCPCGEPIRGGDEIRADGQGQYTGRCCEGDDDE
jgi:hypothetical protein